MRDKDLIRLKHMLDFTKAILSFLQGKRRSDLDSDRLLLFGIVRELEILGEAAGKTTQTTQELFPDIPWRQLVGMRNRLIHAYFDVDHDVIWRTATENLPHLCLQLEKAVSKLKTA